MIHLLNKYRPLNSLYIHVPFCKDKCYYCDFLSFTDKNDYIEAYIASLVKEIYQNSLNYKDIELKSIYIGGGTPSLLEIKNFEQIFSEIYSFFKILNNVEITVEVNPGTIDKEYLKNLRLLGINRLSIGIQSFDESLLRLLNRKHNKKQAIQAVISAKEADFENISVDLIYGLPNQNIKIWEETLNLAANLEIKHISAYGLKIEENTEFGRNMPENIPDDELTVQMYLKAIDILANYGFNHYEISNFSKSGYESKHNLSYWNNEEYLGLGLSAHGYVNGIRYSNSRNLKEYINNSLKKNFLHTVTSQEAVEEAIFLGLRLIQGINIEKFNKRI
ncbi:MAG: radical SAM family heme chaperone HemW [bacterium]